MNRITEVEQAKYALLNGETIDEYLERKIEEGVRTFVRMKGIVDNNDEYLKVRKQYDTGSLLSLSSKSSPKAPRVNNGWTVVPRKKTKPNVKELKWKW